MEMGETPPGSSYAGGMEVGEAPPRSRAVAAVGVTAAGEAASKETGREEEEGTTWEKGGRGRRGWRGGGRCRRHRPALSAPFVGAVARDRVRGEGETDREREEE